MNNSMLLTIWKFIRLDMSAEDFEQWVYAQPSLESELGKQRYLQLISSDFSSKEDVFQARLLLEEYAKEHSDLCECITLRDLADVSMASQSIKVFERLEVIKKRGDPWWWETLYKCFECGQHWLVAQEERHNDVFLMLRQSEDQSAQITANDEWPDIFDRYEDVIRLGQQRGHRVRFADPLESSLWWTMAIIARERPGISVIELAALLDLEESLAAEIAKQAIRKEGVRIASVEFSGYESKSPNKW